MSLTPKAMVFTARAGLLVIAAGAATCVATGQVLPPVALATAGFAASLLTLLAFPRVRRNELLVAVAACSTLTGYLMVLGWNLTSLGAAGAGLAGPAAVALTLSVVRVRNLAASNWHMSFVEWRQYDRRRKPKTAATEELGAVLVQFEHHSKIN